MGVFNPTHYMDTGHVFTGGCTLWAQAPNFDNDYEDSNFWWTANAANDYIVQWNNSCVLRLIIDKINTMSGTDMDSILNAMLSASFSQLQQFIGIIDAYRVAVWNAPFNAEFYAALARGFETWPQY